MAKKKTSAKKSAAAKNKKAEETKTENESKQEIHHHYHTEKSFKFDFGKLSFGLVLILFGIFYLARNFGWIEADINFNPWDLWPLLLIFWGMSLLTSRSWMSIIVGSFLTLIVVVLITILLLGKIEFHFGQDYRPDKTNTGYTTNSVSHILPFSFKQGPADAANIYLTAKAAQLTIAGGADMLLEGDLETDLDSPANMSAVQKEQAGDYYLTLTQPDPISPADKESNKMDIEVNDQSSYNFFLEAYLSDMDINLSDTIVKTLNYTTSDSEAKLALGANRPADEMHLSTTAEQNVSLTMSDSSMKLYLPTEASAEINLSQESSAINLPDDFSETSEGQFQTADTGTKSHHIIIDVDLIDSNLDVEWY